jgi:ABC-2 type transport system ATP-binding protein
MTFAVPVIQIDTLTHRYGRRRGIEGLSLSVGEGELFGFLGPNGAGKTTTIRVMLGLLRPTTGTARIFGLDCWRDGKSIKRDLGYLPGDLRLPGWMNGENALAIYGAVRGRDLTRSGREFAGRFDFDLRVKVRAMSRGMRQKLGLILALAHSPRLLVLDEPTSSLDPLMQQTLLGVLRQWAAEGRTIFFSSHSLNEVEALCDRVAILRDGQLVANEPLAALRARAQHEVVIRWRDETSAARLAPPAFLKLTRREGALWHGTLDGPAHGLVEFLAGKPIEDLNIGRPDLETLFQRYYDGEQEGRP